MDDRSSLVNQLRLDRGDAFEPERNTWLKWLVGIAVLAGVGVAVWLVLGPPRATPVSVAIAAPASTDTAVAPASMLDASGYVVARRQATVSAKTTGRVVEVLIEEGQHVDADQIVARLDDTNDRARVVQVRAQLAQAEARYRAQAIALENAKPTFERNEEQFAREIISAQDFDAAKASYDAARTSLEVAARAIDVARADLAVAERLLEDTVVRAPFAGVVTVKAAQEGEMVSPVSAGGGFTRTGIGTIVDMDSLEVEVDVSENFINRVRAGQAVAVKLNAYPDWAIPGRVIAIIPTADRAKATVRVRIGLDEKDARILPEMGVRVSFLEGGVSRDSGGHDDGGDPDAADSFVEGALAARSRVGAAGRRAVVVPPEAVQVDGETGVVFVLRDGAVERRSVRLGARSPEGQVVLSGLDSGARLAVAMSGELADGARVRVKTQE